MLFNSAPFFVFLPIVFALFLGTKESTEMAEFTDPYSELRLLWMVGLEISDTDCYQHD